MEDNTTTSTPPAESSTADTGSSTGATYGAAFRTQVSRALNELDKLTFVPPNVKERLHQEASKLCLAEAVLEHKTYTTVMDASRTVATAWKNDYRAKTEAIVGRGLSAVDNLLAKLAQ